MLGVNSKRPIDADQTNADLSHIEGGDSARVSEESKNIHQKKQKVTNTSSKEETKALLVSIGYPGKRDTVLQAFTATQEVITKAFENITQSDKEQTDAIFSLNAHFSLLGEALQEFDACLQQIPNREKLKAHLKQNLKYEQIGNLLAESAHLKLFLEKLYGLKSQISHMEESPLRNRISTILINWDSETLDSNDLDIIETLIALNSQNDQNLSIVAAYRKEIRQLHLSMSFTSKNLYMNANGFDSTLSSLLNSSLQDMDSKNEFFSKVLEIKKLYFLINNFKNISSQLTWDNLYIQYFERQIETLKQNIIDKKIELAQIGLLKPTTSSLINLSLFSRKMQEIEERQPITTWERLTDTSVQQLFLNNFLSDRKIAQALHSLKKKIPFNVSFLEYIENGEYKILFSISGSNDALSSEYYTRGFGVKGINNLITNYLREWNKNHPGITFQYVKSYDGQNLKMDEGQWYCSEPKLAIEYSKIKKEGPHTRIGQNNWSIDPTSFNYKEQDACTRHCQPRQRELVDYTPRMNSPIRIVS